MIDKRHKKIIFFLFLLLIVLFFLALKKAHLTGGKRKILFLSAAMTQFYFMNGKLMAELKIR